MDPRGLPATSSGMRGAPRKSTLDLVRRRLTLDLTFPCLTPDLGAPRGYVERPAASARRSASICGPESLLEPRPFKGLCSRNFQTACGRQAWPSARLSCFGGFNDRRALALDDLENTITRVLYSAGTSLDNIDVGTKASMWIVLLIIHALSAFLLLGAITHQTLSVWVPARSRPRSFLARVRAVPSASYISAVILLYIATATMGGIIYTNYRIAARFALEQGHFWKTFGAFELKEHFIAVGLGLLPAYWYFWTAPPTEASSRTRAMLTTLLAFLVWWAFLVGHLTNNIRGLGT